ncbi:MAG: glycerophosphodiester phosphodiesterase [Candidatus Krumholzibacteriia bacterium]
MHWIVLGTAMTILAAVLRPRRGSPRRVRVIAHRGASGRAPENTLPALRLVQELGIRWAEVDVQRTSDGVLVLVHDDNWRRTTGLDAGVRETPWDTVCGLDAGGWFGEAHRGVAPATLAEALELAGEGLHLNVEIKSPHRDPGLGEAVAAAVRMRALQNRVLLTSFDHACIDRLAESGPDLDLGYLAARPIETQHTRVRTHVLLHDVVLERPETVCEAHARGRRVLVWTVDDPHVARRLVHLGVDGIITNHPERLLSLA